MLTALVLITALVNPGGLLKALNNFLLRVIKERGGARGATCGENKARGTLAGGVLTSKSQEVPQRPSRRRIIAPERAFPFNYPGDFPAGSDPFLSFGGAGMTFAVAGPPPSHATFPQMIVSLQLHSLFRTGVLFRCPPPHRVTAEELRVFW